MLKFSNGSSLRVGTSLRSSTFQYLHISEFGKICAKYPDKAREIITGSLNTIGVGQYCFIESTAEGREGYFYELCKQAQANSDSKKELSKLDFKFHFFPWWGQPDYRIGSSVSIGQDMHEYFISLSGIGIKLTDEQKNWYALRYTTQSEDMKREFPSTAEECWEVSNLGTYYAKQITQARLEKRIGHVPYDETIPVYTAWDLGYNDSTTIWFFQVYGKEIRLIDYVEGSGESLSHWLGVVKSKPYIYEKHLAPHDIKAHEYTSGMTRQASARKMGINLIAVPRLEIIPGIDSARNILNRCWFDENKCEKGIRSLENYKKEWNERAACWASQPLHNWASHGADAFNFYAMHPKYNKVMIASPSSLSAEDLPYILTMEAMETVINGLDVDSSTKEVYISHARSLRSFVEKVYPVSPVFKGRRCLLSLSDAATLFEYLETRALKSTTIRAYHDVLLCRALFYAPLPEKQFFSLGAPDNTNSCLRAGKKVFFVPRSFVMLWKNFSCTDSLLCRTFDDRQLHKKIQRLEKYAGLTIESLTPSILRSSAKAAYLTYLSLSDDVLTFLPKRV